MEINFNITGKVAVITGAAGVLCNNMAEHLARKGAKVALLNIFEEKAIKIAEEIKKDGGDAIAIIDGGFSAFSGV